MYVVHCTIRNSSPQNLHICNYFDFGGSFRALVRKTVHLLGIWKILTENRWSTLLLRTNYIHSTLQQLIINIQTRTLIMKYIKALKKVCFIILFWFYQAKIRLIYFETCDVLPPMQFCLWLISKYRLHVCKKKICKHYISDHSLSTHIKHYWKNKKKLLYLQEDVVFLFDKSLHCN